MDELTINIIETTPHKLLFEVGGVEYVGREVPMSDMCVFICTQDFEVASAHGKLEDFTEAELLQVFSS